MVKLKSTVNKMWISWILDLFLILLTNSVGNYFPWIPLVNTKRKRLWIRYIFMFRKKVLEKNWLISIFLAEYSFYPLCCRVEAVSWKASPDTNKDPLESNGHQRSRVRRLDHCVMASAPRQSHGQKCRQLLEVESFKTLLDANFVSLRHCIKPDPLMGGGKM